MDADALRVGEDDVSEDRRALVVKAALCFKLATIHALSNDAMQTPIRDFCDAMAKVFGQEGALFLDAKGNNAFVNEEPVRLDGGSLESAQLLAHLFARLGVSRLRLQDAPSYDEVRDFLDIFQKAYGGDGATFGADANLTLLVIDKPAEVDRPKLEPRQYVLRAYAALIAALHDELSTMTEGRKPRLVGLRRLVQILCDATDGHDNLLIALGRLQQNPGLPAYHMVAVASLVLVMARRLGVSRRAMVDLVMQGLFADTGLVDLPPPSDPKSFEAGVARIPVRSVFYACYGGVSVSSMGRLATSWEHRLGVDANPGGAAKLVAVASAFDTMTSKQAPGLGLPPETAIRYILYQSGTRFAPWATKLLANVLGLYPVGTTVRLSDGAVGVVIHSPLTPELFARPRVRLWDSDGAPGQEVDLAARPDLEIDSSVTPDDIDSVLEQFMRV